MSGDKHDPNLPAGRSSRSEIDAFLEKVAVTPMQRPAGRRGRLVFAIDATASREPTWDMACQIQSEMFSSTDDLGGLEVQLAFYRGFGEMKVTPWLESPDELVRRMIKVRCLAGRES